MRERIEAAIKDAYYAARDNGGTMHTAATDATDAVLAILGAPDEATVERLAEASHDAYEAAAVEAGWETQQRSRKPWADVPAANKATVRVTICGVLAALAALGAPEQTGHHGGQGEAVSFDA